MADNITENNLNLYPLMLSHITKDIIWGGTKLKALFNIDSDRDNIAESWELSARDDGMSTIQNGKYKGLLLCDYLSALGIDKFPLLIKFIDSNDDLSVQVHPNDGYTGLKSGDTGKCEMWYVLSADKDSELIYGTENGVTYEDVVRAIKDNNILPKLRRVSVKPGDVFFIPSGQIHALKGGITVAEIQQNSNTTYRIYDYDRLDKNGKKRELHIKEALDVINIRSDYDIYTLQFEGNGRNDMPNSNALLLCDSEYFRVSVLDINGSEKVNLSQSTFISMLFIGGDGDISMNGYTEHFSAGNSFFLPPSKGFATVSGRGTVLISEP